MYLPFLETRYPVKKSGRRTPTLPQLITTVSMAVFQPNTNYGFTKNGLNNYLHVDEILKHIFSLVKAT